MTERARKAQVGDELQVLQQGHGTLTGGLNAAVSQQMATST